MTLHVLHVRLHHPDCLHLLLLLTSYRMSLRSLGNVLVFTRQVALSIEDRVVTFGGLVDKTRLNVAGLLLACVCVCAASAGDERVIEVGAGGMLRLHLAVAEA